MLSRLAILFIPSLIGLLFRDAPWLSLAWSFAGSGLIAGVALTRWFRESSESALDRPLRPVLMVHVFFLGLHGFGGIVHALDVAGYTLRGWEGPQYGVDPYYMAAAQQLMLLAHAATTAGMKLVGFRYPAPAYTAHGIRAARLLMLSAASVGAAILLQRVPGFSNIAAKFGELSVVVLLVALAFPFPGRTFQTRLMTVGLVAFNLYSQAISGWKGDALWTMLALGGMVYPRFRGRVVAAGCGFLLFWALFLYPFGAALRPMAWYEGVEQQRAVQLSIERAMTMSMSERMDGAWTMLAGRANELYQFRRYLEWVPAQHPYFKFEICDEALVALVPRLIWTEKPDLERLAMERVYQAGVVGRHSNVSAKSNFYQDAYLSFGWIGVAVFCVFLGALMMLVSRACERFFGGYVIGTCLVYTALFGHNFHQPLTFLFFVGAIWGSILLTMLLVVLGRGFDVLRPAAPAAASVRRVVESQRQAGVSVGPSRT